MAKARVSRARAVDWALIEGATAQRPHQTSPPQDTLEQLLLLVRRLPSSASLFELTWAAFTELRTLLPVERVALYVLAEGGRWWQGVVGTDASGQLVDERSLRHSYEPSHSLLHERLVGGRRAYEALEDAPWIAHAGEQTQVIGRGWFAQTPVNHLGKPVGMLYNDAACSRRPFDPDLQQYLAVFAALMAEAWAKAREQALASERAGLSRELRIALEVLARQPDADAAQLAEAAGLSPRALGILCARELGQPLAMVRNELKLRLFFELLETHGLKRFALLELAFKAGFGSYAQFHRVFTAVLGQSPRDYLAQEHKHPLRP